MTARPMPIFLNFLLGNDTLVTWRGALWREHRRFALRTLRTLGLGKPLMEALIGDEIEYMIGKMKANPKSEPLAISKLLAPSVSNVVVAIITGKRFDYDHPCRKMLDEMFTTARGQFVPLTGYFSSYIRVVSLLLKIPNPITRKITATAKQFKIFMEEEIEEHIERYDEKNVNDFIDHYIEEYQAKHGSSETTMASECFHQSS